MKRKITSLTTAIIVLFLMLIAIPNTSWGQSDKSTVYTTESCFTSVITGYNVTIGSNNFAAAKRGTSGSAGSLSLTVPSGTKYLHFHAAGWNGETVTISITPNTNVSPTSIGLTSDSNIKGSETTYDVDDTKCPTDYYKVITFTTALTSNTSFTFTASSGKRFVIWGVNTEEESTDEETSVAIDDSGITNRDVALGTSAGSFSAVVKDSSSEVIGGAEVTWSSSKTGVATINATTGVVTLVKKGTTTITAYYAGDAGIYQSSSDTYELTVTNSAAGDGSLAKPFTPSEARDALDAEEISPETDYYVRGIIAKIGTFNAGTGQLTYWISDDGSMTNNVQCYKGKNVDGAAFAAATDLEVGDIATVKGKLTIYSGTTYEFTENNEVVSITTRTKVNIATFTATTNPLILGETTTTTTSVTNDQPGWTPASYTYESDDTDVATVNASGVVTAVSKGTAHITVTADVAANNSTYKVGDSKSIEITVSNPSHTAFFSINGVIDPANNGDVEEGEEITFPSDPSTIGGKSFVGWVATQIEGTTDVAPSFVSSPTMSTSDITYYAVFANSSTTTGWRKLAVGDVSEAGTYALLTTDGHAFNGSISSGHGQVTESAFSFNNNVATSAPTGTCEITLTVSGSGFTMYNATNKYLYASKAASGGLAWHNSEDCYWYNNSGNWQYSKNYSGSYAKLRDYNNNSLRTYSNNSGNVLVFAHKTSIDIYTAYCTFFIPVDGESHEMTEDITIPEGVTYTVSSEIIIPDGIVLTVNGTLDNDDPDKLIIADGGQLYCNNSVAATVEKNISAASTKAVDGWVALSSAVHTSGETYETISTGTNIATDPYDMFYYDEASSQWINKKGNAEPLMAAYDTLQRGRGYIYRNGNAITIECAGETNVGDFKGPKLTWAASENKLKGFNLIGNPYPHKIYKGVDFATQYGETNDTLVTGYYILNGDGSWTAKDNSVAIDVNQAILVEATEWAHNKRLYFKERTKTPDKSNNDNIQFTIENLEYSDITYAWFDKGCGLKKINHRNANIPMLYVNQDGTDYAIAMMSDNTKLFNLSFKAMTIGKYTLSYKANGNFSYLHVIDRLTGDDVDMLLDGTYSFIASPSDNPDRFIVKLSYNNGNNIIESETFAYQNGNDIIIDGEGDLQVFDVTGRVVKTQRMNGIQTINLNSQGVYIFRLNEKTQKIVVK